MAVCPKRFVHLGGGGKESGMRPCSSDRLMAKDASGWWSILAFWFWLRLIADDCRGLWRDLALRNRHVV